MQKRRHQDIEFSDEESEVNRKPALKSKSKTKPNTAKVVLTLYARWDVDPLRSIAERVLKDPQTAENVCYNSKTDGDTKQR